MLSRSRLGQVVPEVFPEVHSEAAMSWVGAAGGSDGRGCREREGLWPWGSGRWRQAAGIVVGAEWLTARPRRPEAAELNIWSALAGADWQGERYCCKERR